ERVTMRGFSRWLHAARAAMLASALSLVILGPVSAGEIDEGTVKQAVADVIAQRSKDGAFVFHDPKLDADLNLVFEQVKIVRGMQGYGWFANTIFHDKDIAQKKYAIDFWFKPEGDKLPLMDIRVQKGPKAGRR